MPAAPLLSRVRSRSSETAAGLAAAGILTQIAYPLLGDSSGGDGGGQALRAATVLSVILLAAAAVTHAGAVWGLRRALTLLVVAGGLGLVAETIGVHTGLPFGDYAYTDRLGPKLLGVPVVVPLAWTMLGYPCLLLGRRLSGRAPWLTGGLALAAWDLYLDPQMVEAGNWTWHHPEPALPGVPGVPLTNYAGWVLVAGVIVAVLDRALPDPGGAGERQGVPAVVLTWTWIGSAIGNLFFFDRPWVAVYGLVGMGLLVVPYLRTLPLRKGSA
jgi:uncharacterized membrane protein